MGYEDKYFISFLHRILCFGYSSTETKRESFDQNPQMRRLFYVFAVRLHYQGPFLSLSISDILRALKSEKVP